MAGIGRPTYRYTVGHTETKSQTQRDRNAETTTEIHSNNNNRWYRANDPYILLFHFFPDGKSLAAKRHCKFIEVSALLNHKTDDLLVGITRQIRLRKARTTSAHGGGPNGNSPDNGGPVGCLQRAAMEAFRKLFKRRPIESTSCDDLFTPWRHRKFLWRGRQPLPGDVRLRRLVHE